MNLIKTLGLAALTALMVMAFAGTSSAMAESTALCKADENPCEVNHIITHVHAVTQTGTKTILLTVAFNVECDGLFLGDARSSLASPLILDGTVTYTNCANKCAVTEENGPAEVKILKTGHESASLTFKLLLHVVCGASINCSYIGEGLTGSLTGPLLSITANGEFKVEKQAVKKDSGGFLCPPNATIDVSGTSLDAIYITN